VFSLQGKDDSKPAGNWFQLLMVLLMEEYLPTSVLVPSPNFPIMILPTQVTRFASLSHSAFQAETCSTVGMLC